MADNTPHIGIQLYTVRMLTDDAQFRETLHTLADMGFAGVEFAWQYGGMAPAELASFLASLSLACCGMHVGLDELLDANHPVYDYALATGSPYVTTSLAGREHEWDVLLPQLNQAGRIALEKGLTFTYHNHWQEFDAPGAFDRLLAETDPAVVKLELDLGWIAKAGLNPLALWEQNAPRIPQIHLRDYDARTQQICDVGDGFIDVSQLLIQARRLGTRWLIYEQDNYPVSPWDSCRVCSERLKCAGAY